MLLLNHQKIEHFQCGKDLSFFGLYEVAGDVCYQGSIENTSCITYGDYGRVHTTPKP